MNLFNSLHFFDRGRINYSSTHLSINCVVSDSSNEDDDYFEDDDNMFSRLEETRARLESELGCETFLKAYKTVQVNLIL